jgi:hypothetical protein
MQEHYMQSLRRAFDAPQSLDACQLLNLTDGRIMAFHINNRIYLIAAKDSHTTRFSIDLNARPIRSVNGDAIRRSPVIADKRMFPDAKFFYFLFDRANRLRDRISPQPADYLCLPPKATRLSASTVWKSTCSKARE